MCLAITTVADLAQTAISVNIAFDLTALAFMWHTISTDTGASRTGQYSGILCANIICGATEIAIARLNTAKTVCETVTNATSTYAIAVISTWSASAGRRRQRLMFAELLLVALSAHSAITVLCASRRPIAVLEHYGIEIWPICISAH
jgi:hypothetical protein